MSIADRDNWFDSVTVVSHDGFELPGWVDPESVRHNSDGTIQFVVVTEVLPSFMRRAVDDTFVPPVA